MYFKLKSPEDYRRVLEFMDKNKIEYNFYDTCWDKIMEDEAKNKLHMETFDDGEEGIKFFNENIKDLVEYFQKHIFDFDDIIDITNIEEMYEDFIESKRLSIKIS